MLCPGCGQANAEAARFCTACGKELIPMPPPPAVPQGGPTTAGEAPLYSPPAYPTVLCRVCGNLLPTSTRVCLRCGTPIGMIVNAGDPTANSYIPVAMPVPLGSPVGNPNDRSNDRSNGRQPHVRIPNNSGQRGEVPVEMQSGWNWGAAFVTFLWAAKHRIYWYVIVQPLMIGLMVALLYASGSNNNRTVDYLSLGYMVLYLLVNIVFRIYFGVRGSRLAWRNRAFDSLYHAIAVQEAWQPAGIVCGILALVVGGLGGMLLFFAIIGTAISQS